MTPDGRPPLARRRSSMAQRQATVVARDKNRKMEKITANVVHKKGDSCVVLICRAFKTLNDQARHQSDMEPQERKPGGGRARPATAQGWARTAVNATVRLPRPDRVSRTSHRRGEPVAFVIVIMIEAGTSPSAGN
uniref:hypothetical protein n=1 Tax=Paractinoplanes polyasparticus TaxID=2856853 RepID=UPI001C854C17|nr:hypothetical protein [Actinoplanes polyasparticus]